MAAYQGNAEIVEMLITAGANIDAADKEGPAGLQAGLHALRGWLRARGCCSDP